ncbi:ClpP/crotonase-like domain-containing protein [Phaeosphaeria sp. MPI-PUGE-AT-0046c]|nr:ClpP/crotonase-like domain-containing protein [Phaeosphaeria sp. MPI-PUGE-AT-0046c]
MDVQNSKSPNLIISTKDGGVAVVELNRPQKRNALSQALINELVGVLSHLEHDATVSTVVITSSGPFSAGADLVELAALTTVEAHRISWLKDLDTAVSNFRKPLLAAVRGFAFGGGFELALMCDMIFASADARFGFPEIKLGTIPGAGGTQRLTKTIGKQKAMELILTGAPAAAAKMERWGIVNRVMMPDEDVLEETLKVARTVASFSTPAVGLAKQAVLAAETTTLGAGLEIERALYYSSFSLADCCEGVAAFIEKRPASVQNR